MKAAKGITAVSLFIGSKTLFEVKYYGPIASYRANGGPRRWTLKPLANRKAGKAMAAAFEARRDDK